MFSLRTWAIIISIAFIFCMATILDGPSVRSASTPGRVARLVFNSAGTLASDSAEYHLNGPLNAWRGGNNEGPYVAATFLPEGTSPRAATTTMLASSSTSIVSGDSVTFTATVKAASGTEAPTGTVTFLDDTAKIGSAAINGSGVATLTTTTLSIGGHSVTAAYSGDQNFASSTSDAVTVSVAGMGGLPAAVTWTLTAR